MSFPQDYKSYLDGIYEAEQEAAQQYLERLWATVTCGMCEMSYLPSESGYPEHDAICFCEEHEEFYPSDMLSGEIECEDVLCASM